MVPTVLRTRHPVLQDQCIEHPNCRLLFEGDQAEINRVKECKRNWTTPPDYELYKKAKNCSWIRAQFSRELENYISNEEMQFPLAFALSVFESSQQIFRFLKIIYRPHNLYCIHYDRKSDHSFQQLMINIANCLPNVIVPGKIENVIWGWHTIVDAQLNCMHDLYDLRDQFPWKYVITLCGKEVPLRTNREMVQTLLKLNGTSAVKSNPNRKHEELTYWVYEHILKQRMVHRTSKKLGPVPFDLKVYKGASYFGLTESFVKFLLHDKVAIEFRKFMDQTFIPDEHFIATLFRRPGVPGGYNEKYARLAPNVSSSIWLTRVEPGKGWKSLCSGWRIHHICILSSGDLHRLNYSPRPDSKKQTFFHNKFYMERDRVVMDCAEEELERRIKEERLKDNYPRST